MKTIRRSILLAVVLAGIVATGAFAGSVISTPTAQATTLFRGAVIKLGKTPYILQDQYHAAIGITRVGLASDKCDLLVNTDWIAGESRIVAAIAEEDETLSRLGVQAGISGGNLNVRISLYRAGRHICANSTLFGSSANIWLSLTYSANAN